MAELKEIEAAIPHDQLAVQYDVASAVFARLERDEASAYGGTKEEMQANFSRILTEFGNHVSPDVDLLYHLCYGDSNHKHAAEPTDMSDMVEFTNRISQAMNRSIQMVHMPVPRERSDAAYFAPLANLRLRPETTLCLGLVHHTDGISGTLARMAMARNYVRGFMIGTECGFGRREPGTISALLQIHAQAAEAQYA